MKDNKEWDELTKFKTPPERLWAEIYNLAERALLPLVDWLSRSFLFRRYDVRLARSNRKRPYFNKSSSIHEAKEGQVKHRIILLFLTLKIIIFYDTNT